MHPPIKQNRKFRSLKRKAGPGALVWRIAPRGSSDVYKRTEEDDDETSKRPKRPSKPLHMLPFLKVGTDISQSRVSWLPANSKHLSKAIDYYIEVILPSAMIYMGVLGPEKMKLIRGSEASRIATSYMSAEAIAAFAFCAAPGGLDPSTSNGKSMIACRAKFLERVHGQLQAQRVDDVLVTAMALLLVIDSALGLREHSEAHRRGIEEVIRLIGGMEKIETSMDVKRLRSLRYGLSMNELCCYTKPPDEVESLEFYCPDEIECSERLKDLPPLPSGFLDLIYLRKVSWTAIDMLNDFFLWLPERDSVSKLMWDPPRPYGLSFLDKAIYIALWAIQLDVAPNQRALPCYAVSRAPARGVSLLLDDSLWEDDLNLECIAWLATVIMSPWNHFSLPYRGEVKDLLMERLMSRLDAAKEWSSLEEVLRKFFWLEELAPLWQRTWNSFYRSRRR